VFAHNGVTVPYQLQACPPTETELDDNAGLEDERGTELGANDELLRGTLESAALEVTTELQIVPVIVGTCALPAPLVPCTPNSTLEFTAILLFQPSGVAV
jgi:hypothetical protein